MSLRHHHSAWQCWADVLMCFLMMFTLMTSLLMVVTHISPPTSGAVKPDADYLITLTWDTQRNVDLDLWLQDPAGTIVFYNNREDKNISLDRDSRGFATNKIALPDGHVILSPNQEVISIRGRIPGDYVVAVGYYDGKDARGASYRPGDPAAVIAASVTVQAVNPVLRLVDSAGLTLTHIKDAQNALAFHIAEDGRVTVLPTPPENLIRAHVATGGRP